ncbi:MAG: sigma-70 family RNA polymerase sigma factor [Phycisphaeraceae bacterium]|nr:MAG: sigma-70 family RNA polymerase sigma factor [Phycisphaeraceae bacterium]
MRPTAAEDNPARPPGADRLGALVAEAASGDESAWESIVSLYGRRIYAMAKSRLRDAESAEEITQSVFATLAERLRGGDTGYEERGQFEPWLFRITMNRVRDEGRRRQRRAADTIPFQHAASVPAAEPALDGEDRVGPLREALGRLDDRDREVVELRHHGQMSFNQIAELLDEPLGTVLARHHRALKKIKKELERVEASRS